MSFKKEYKEKVYIIESFIEQEFASFNNFPKKLRESMKYSLLSGGKRLRPILFVEFYELFGGKIDRNVIKMATAIEAIHSYSLIHDDLPCMDDDDMRRGKPTNHKIFGEGVAVLAGDALLNYAYELIFAAIMNTYDDKKGVYTKVGALISKYVGAKGLIGGQVEDIGASSTITCDMLRYIMMHKTGDLIVSACVGGAMLAGASKDDLAIVKSYAENFAFAFQICDDILDYEEKKNFDEVSFVKFYGKFRAKESLGESSEIAIKCLAKIKTGDTSFLKEMTNKFAKRKA